MSLDPAVAKARAVVGLYGDPTVSWSIAIDVSLPSPRDPAALTAEASKLVASHRHLGTSPTFRSFAAHQAAGVLSAVLDDPYGDHDPLLRLALREDGQRLLLAAHHGAVDGLGLLAVLGFLLGEPVVSTARGIGDRSASVGFLKSVASRLSEAACAPPARLARITRRNSPDTRGDVTASLDINPTRATTHRTLTASAQAVAAWNAARAVGSPRIVVAVGASRRDGADASPDRDTAYLRVRVPSPVTSAGVARALAETSPEPTFPERPASRWATLVTRALRNRLGSTLLVSNLGLIQGAAGIGRLAFYPVAAGPQALAVGVASTASYTTITVRMPRADFTAEGASTICTAIADCLLDPSGPS